MGEHYYRSSVDALLAQVLVTLGNPEEAVELSRTAEELAEDDDVETQVYWRVARARAYAQSGRIENAGTLVGEAVDLARGTVNLSLLAGALADQAEILRAAARPEEAEPPLREALQLYEVKGDVTSVDRVRGLLGEPGPVDGVTSLA
jgi:ATP/maltotriose-dependent transcriptional regulator MalT